MPRAIVWTQERDQTIARMRKEGATWDAIATAIDISRWAVIQRAAAIGVSTAMVETPTPEPRIDKRRPPLRAGDPLALQILAEAPRLDLD